MPQLITKTKESESDGQVGQKMYYFNWNLRSAIELYTLWEPEEMGINLGIYFRKFTFFAHHLIRSLKLINRPKAPLSLVHYSLSVDLLRRLRLRDYYQRSDLLMVM